MNKAKRRGFSLIELVVVVGIFGLIAALALPSFTAGRREAKLNSYARRMVAHLKKARNLAATGKVDSDGDATRQAGIRFDSPRQYVIFIDEDLSPNGNEETVEVVNFNQNSPDLNIDITAPAPGTELRFHQNGTLDGNADVNIVLREGDSERFLTIQLTWGGRAKIL